MTFHTIIIVGRLGRDPEMRYTNTGQAVTTFSVATDRKFTASDDQQKRVTTWFNVTVWGKQAENCNTFLQKGQMVLVEGSLRADEQSGGPRVFQRSDGTPGAKFEITAQNVRFLSAKSDTQDAGTVGEEPEGMAAGTGGDDIPF